jgi:hypothetical protein
VGSFIVERFLHGAYLLENETGSNAS